MVAGPITIDVVLRIDAMPSAAGSTVANEILVAAGGKGANPAVTAAKLGATVRLVGAVGDDPQGREAVLQLHHDGIDLDAVSRIPGAMTGQIVHLVEPQGRRRYIEHPGANGHFHPRPRDIAHACRDARLVVISTAMPADAVKMLVLGAGDRALSVSHAPVTVVDPTGGGDAFIAAFAVALGRDEDLRTAALLATAAAGHTVSHLGGRPTFTDETALWSLAERCAVSEAHAG
jgi:ribokinase